MRVAWQKYGDYRSKKAIQKYGIDNHTMYESVQYTLRNEIPIAGRRWRGQPNIEYLGPLVERTKRDAEQAEKTGQLSGAKAWAWLYTLVAQAPRAALAQVQMDKHPHGCKARGERLYELIDFNDAFVSTVLALPESELPKFTTEVRRLIDWFCKRVGVHSFSDEQFTAIVHGLEREIAVFLGAQTEGFKAQMTNRASDAMGIDMILTDPLTLKTVNIDCKAPSAYRHRIYDLLREGRLREEEVTAAEMLGFIGELNGHGNQRVKVVLWRIDRDRYGEITNFAFADTTELGKTARTIIQTYGEEIRE